MPTKTIKEKIIQVLATDERLWNEAKDDLNQTLLLDLVEKIDEKIIGLLLEEESLREKFFVKIKGVYVFKMNAFKFFMEENRVNNSYTQYKNRIGLTDGKRFLSDSGDVVLDFPYKDCVLAGGQSTEEGEDTYFAYEEEKTRTVKGKKVTELAGYKEKKAKRKEVFFNQILAKDEIDRLFDPKALVNWKRYTQNGEEEVQELRRDESGTLKENLIIKGNNLLALHSLKKQFAGKVKLIYIDPPYNTGSDDFKYNDNFNHATWLTFIRNRLEIAKRLLSSNGLIFVQCDYHEDAYLRLVMDEVFKGNFIQSITVKTSSASGPKMAHVKNRIPKLKDTILVYSNSDFQFVDIPSVPKENWDSEYSKIITGINDSDSKQIRMLLSKKAATKEDSDRVNSILKTAKLTTMSVFDSEKKNDVEWLKKNSYRIVADKQNTSLDSALAQLSQHPKQDVACFLTKSERLILYRTDKNFGEDTRVEIVFAIDNLTMNPCDLWLDISTSGGFSEEGGVSLPRGKKPEALLQRVITMSTTPGETVLDFFMGSGTTAAVSHKLRRQYIGIEQLDYKENSGAVRLQNVISGEQSGISKSVDWQGGGDFIYLELAQWNENAKAEILTCESLTDLEKLFERLYESYFLNYNLKLKEFKEKVMQEENFKALSLDEQKKIFLAMLDLNQLYVQESEMADRRFGISEKDQALTKAFYYGE